MEGLQSAGIFLIIAGTVVTALVLLSASLASRRRRQLFGSEESLIPVNLASVSDAVLVATVGGRITYANEVARRWFELDGTEPDLWILSQRVRPAAAFLELFAAEGQAAFTLRGREVQATSHRVAVGDSAQFVVTLREEVPLPTLDREERGSAKALQVLAEITRAINASLDLPVTLNASLEGARRLIDFDAAQICLWDGERELLTPVARSGPEAYVRAAGQPDQTYTPDQGYSGHIARKRIPLLVADAATFQDVYPAIRPVDPPLRSYLGVPLMVRSRFIGTLEVISAVPESFDRDDLAILQLIAEQAAIAIENARQFSEQADRVVELSGLQKIAGAISTLQDPEKLFGSLGQRVAELMDTEYAGVLLWDREGEKLIAQKPLFGVSDAITARYVIPLEKGTPARVLWEDVSFWFSNDVPNDKLAAELGLMELIEMTGLRTTAMVEMRLGDERLGVLQVSNKNSGQPFTMEDIRLLQLYADQAAIVVESARLYAEEQSRVAELQGLQQIVQAMSSFDNPEELYAQLTRRIAELMRVEVCGVLIHEAETDRLVARTPFYGMADEVAAYYAIPVGKRGLARDVWREHELFLSNNVPTDDSIDALGLREATRNAGLHSLMLAPLSTGGRRFGMLQVSNKTDGSEFNDGDRRLLAIFAGQAAALVENARLYQDTNATLRKRAAELRSVSRISHELNATLELERILEVIAVEALRAEGARWGNLVMFDRADDDATIVPTMRFGIDLTEEGRLLVQAAAHGGDTLTIDDFEKVQGYPKPLPEVRAALVAPIHFEGKVVGAISLYGDHTKSLGPSAAEYVQALCSQATIAVTNATRHAEQQERSEIIKHRADQLTRLFELGRAFRSDQSVDENLSHVARAVSETVGFQIALISVLDEVANDLHHVAGVGLSDAAYRKAAARRVAWSVVESHLKDDHRMSGSYLIPRDAGSELVEALGLARKSKTSVSGRPGQWITGDLLVVPLRSSAGQIIGLMSVDHPRDGMIPTRNTIELLEIFANQAAIILENTRLYQSVEERAEELQRSLGNLSRSYEELDKLSQEMIRKDLELSGANELLKQRAGRLLALHRVMESVDSTHGPETALTDIAASVLREMDGIGQCVIALEVPDERRLEVVAAEGRFPEEINWKSLLAGENPLSEALHGGGPVIFTRTERDRSPGAKLAKAIGASTLIAVPLRFNAYQTGVLAVGSNRRDRPFSDDDRDLFTLLGSQIVVEYENARLYEAVQDEALAASGERDRLQQLHLITTALQQTETLDDRLRVIARGIRQVGWGKVAVMLLDENLNAGQMATAGYNEEEEKTLRKRLIPGEVWQRRLEDPQFASLRIGSSYFLAHDSPWVIQHEGGKKAVTAPLSEDDGRWHPRDQIYLPMYAGTQIIGMINLRDPHDGQRPSEASLRPLELFAQQASSALENARLYQETLGLQAYNEAVVQSIQQGIIVLSADGVVETFNAFIRAQYGWSDSMIGRPLHEVQPALAESGLMDDLRRRVLKGEQAERTGFQLPGPEEWRSVNIYAYPRMDEAGEITGAVVLIEDITQRARLEADIARRGQQLAALTEVSRRITAALTTDDVLASAAREAGEVIAHDRIAVWLSQPDGSLRLSASEGYGKGEIRHQTVKVSDDKLFSAIVKGREPVLIPDARATKRLEGGEKRATFSWLGAPLTSGGQVHGVLVFEKVEAHAYAPADSQVAAAYANQVAVALDNARLFEEASERAAELDARNQRLALLNRISSTIGRSLDQIGILQSTADELGAALQMPSVSAYLFDQDNRTARLVVQYPSHPDGSVPEITFSLEDSPLMEELRISRQLIEVEDAAADARLESLRPVLKARKIKAGLFIPMVVGNVAHGLVVVESPTAPHVFGAERIELAQTISNQAAVAIQNAQLFQETVARQRELSILFEASRIASSSLDLEKVVASAAGYFMRALDVDGCMISLIEPAADRLTALIHQNREGQIALTEKDHRHGLASYPATAGVIAERGALTLSLANPDLSTVEADWLKDHGAASALVIPLVARDESIALAELWSQDDRRFNQRDIRLARALAASIATAMENARLLDEAQHRLSELQTINDISRALTGTISTEDLYGLLQNEIGEVLGTHSLTIARLNPLTGLLDFPLAVRDGLRIHVEPMAYGADLYSYVIETREPMLISRDVRTRLDELGVDHIEQGLRSFLGVPMVSGEKVLGVLAVESYGQEITFQEADLRVLSPIAAQVAVSLENTRLYTELQQRLSETTTLQEVSRVVNSALDLTEIFNRVVSELAEAFKYPLIGLFTIVGEELVMQASHGNTPEEDKKWGRLPLNKGVIGRVARSGLAELVTDLSRDPDYAPSKSWARSEIAVPVVSDEKVLGVLAVQSGVDSPLDDSDLQLLKTFAGQVATAVVNASLYTEMVRLSEELEERVEERTHELREEKDRIDILYKIAVELTASLDLDMVLNRALKLVGDAVGAEHGSLFLIDPQSDKLIFRASMSDHEIIPPGGRQIQLSRHEGMAGWVMDRRESIVVDNVQVDPRWSNVPGTEERRSLIGASLIANEEVLGCIFFASDVENAFKESHLTLVEAAAQQVAVSITNAELYRLIRDQAERLGAMLRSQQTEAAKSQAILESIADGVMVSDAAGEIILFNAAAERILDLRREEVLGRPATDLAGLYGAGAARWAEMLKLWASDPTSYTGEFLAEQIEVSEKVVSVHVSPAVHGEEFVGLVSVFRDITREVMADRIKSEFVATVSHELRTPMTSIKGYADLMLLGAAGEINPEQKRFLDVIKGNADRLSFLVNDLLDISRIEQGGVELDLRPIKLREVIDGVIESMEGRRENEGRTLKVKTDIPDDLPTFEGDYDRITQVITNIILNAYQYTPDEGSVTVKVVKEENFLRMDVIDTGIGIPDDIKPRIFDRFVRGEDPMVMKTAGTGLGLSIVKHLVTMHHGEVTFVSEMGEGTTFSLRMPFTQAEGKRLMSPDAK